MPPSLMHFGEHSIQPGLQGLKPPNRPSDAKITAAAMHIPLQLRLSAESREAIHQHLNDVGGVDRQTFNYSIKHQDAATRFLMSLDLYIPDASTDSTLEDTLTGKRDVRSKFSIVWSRKSQREGKIRCKRLFQCLCGVAHTESARAGRKAKTRNIPWEFTGCLAFITVITMHDSGRIYADLRFLAVDSVTGILEHSDSCKLVIQMFKPPAIPLHPEVRELALELLQHHEPLYLVRIKCADFAITRFGDSPGDNHHRFTLADHETASLYRTIASESGISPRTMAEDNLDTWFRPKNPRPPAIHAAAFRGVCLHYQGCKPGVSDRFELIISTPAQQEAAWRFGHKNLVLTDLTFGFCSARALLAILMVIDKEGRGIPIAFIMFTARKYVKAVHADYDTEVLSRLYGLFKSKLGKNSAGDEIEFTAAITDMDPRERHALRHHWPDSFLLICIFHVRQAWRNALTKYLRSVPAGDDRKKVRVKLSRFLVELIRTDMTYTDVVEQFNEEWYDFHALAVSDIAADQIKGEAGIKFLLYLKRGYMNTEADWKPWSLAGAAEVARRLSLPITDVPRTNNHLESFNGRIKGVYFAPYARHGRGARPDAWVTLLVTKIIPATFERLWRKDASTAHKNQMMYAPSAVISDDDAINVSLGANIDFDTWEHELEMDDLADTSDEGASDDSASETVEDSVVEPRSDIRAEVASADQITPSPDKSPPSPAECPPTPLYCFTPPSQLTPLPSSLQSPSPAFDDDSNRAEHLSALLRELRNARAMQLALAREALSVDPTSEPQVRALLSALDISDAHPGSPTSVAGMSDLPPTSTGDQLPIARPSSTSPIRTTRRGLTCFSPMKKQQCIQSHAI
ncbi:hypothetical protein BD626DRAFT_406215 [Schizophyllum amplum]|uniref:MULE transposase domain-containing protein n=1 Tax=Schizophyllum amplum TaxID=97359 RepID=A0A550C8P6_9AGAR|nr:hypothetical protein BD626DRAFT_406215 [Auriculariopsis ampla]